jgi:hypothetical protein
MLLFDQIKKQSFIAPLFSFEGLFLFPSSFFTASHVYIRLGSKAIFLLRLSLLHLVWFIIILSILGNHRRYYFLFLELVIA